MKVTPYLINQIKSIILQSRYQAARLANQELLKLYFFIGKLLHERIEKEKWGAKVLEEISAQLQEEMIGLKVFSAPNLKRMRLFYASGIFVLKLDRQCRSNFNTKKI